MHTGYRVGLPDAPAWREALNTDAVRYGGGGVRNDGVVRTEPVPWHGRARSAALTLPPLAVVWLEPADGPVPDPEEADLDEH